MTVGDSALYGYQSFIGFCEETALGTHKTATAFLEFNSESFKKTVNKKVIESINNTRNPRRVLSLEEGVEGGFEVDMMPASDAFVWLLKQGMGGTVTTDTHGASLSYHHTVYEGDMESNQSSVGSGDTKAISVTISKGGKYFQYDGCRINSFTLKGEVGSELKASFEVIGMDSTISSDSMPAIAFSDIAPLDFSGVKFEIGDTTTSLSEEYIQSFEITVANNLAADAQSRRLGSKILDILPPLKRMATVKVAQRFDTTSAYSLSSDHSAKVMKFTFDNLQTIGAAGSTTYSMFITCRKAYLNMPAVEVGEPGILSHELEYQIVQDTTTTDTVAIEVNNNTSSY